MKKLKNTYMNIDPSSITNILSTSPIAAVLFWMVWVMRQDIKEKNQENKELVIRMSQESKEQTNQILSAFEGNTTAITKFGTLQKEQMKAQKEHTEAQERHTQALNSLTDKINDVLTSR